MLSIIIYKIREIYWFKVEKIPENPIFVPSWAHFAQFWTGHFFIRKSGCVTFLQIFSPKILWWEVWELCLTDGRTDWWCWFHKDSRRVLTTLFPEQFYQKESHDMSCKCECSSAEQFMNINNWIVDGHNCPANQLFSQWSKKIIHLARNGKHGLNGFCGMSACLEYLIYSGLFYI